MPKQDYYSQGQLTDVAYLILVALAKPLHGYAIMAQIEDITSGEVNMGPATLYTTLRKLTQAGFIELLADSDKRKIYQITTLGKQALELEIEKRERYATYGKQALQNLRGDSTC